MTSMENQRFRDMLAALSPGNGVPARLNRTKFHIDRWRHAQAYTPLLAAPETSALGRLVDDRPEALAFVRAPYFCAGWSVAERLARFTTHVTTLTMLPPLDFAVTRSIDLIALPAIADALHIVMDKPIWFHREGVLTLNLFEGDTRLFSLVFALEPIPSGMRAMIGGIQGRNLPDILDRYRVLTKQAQGIRPRDLLIELFRMLCANIGVTEIHAISDRGRHNRHPYFGRDIMRSLALDYDEIWRDRGGVRVDAWWFDLPLHGERRAEADIPAKKRSMYRQRYAMLDMIKALVDDAWTDMKPVIRAPAK